MALRTTNEYQGGRASLPRHLQQSSTIGLVKAIYKTNSANRKSEWVVLVTKIELEPGPEKLSAAGIDGMVDTEPVLWTD